MAADARFFPAEPGHPARLLSGEELAVEGRYGLDRLCELAAEKDRGLTPALFAEMLGRFGRLRRSTTLATTGSAENSRP